LAETQRQKGSKASNEMSAFSWFCLMTVSALSYLGSRVGWVSQLIGYAVFGLLISGSLLLQERLKSVYSDSGVPEPIAGLTALITLLVFSALLVIPSLRLHRKFYSRTSETENLRRSGGGLLGFVLSLVLIYFTGQSLLKYGIIMDGSESYDSTLIRIIRAVSKDHHTDDFSNSTGKVLSKEPTSQVTQTPENQ
jgi:hypothetical protein